MEMKWKRIDTGRTGSRNDRNGTFPAGGGGCMLMIFIILCCRILLGILLEGSGLEETIQKRYPSSGVKICGVLEIASYICAVILGIGLTYFLAHIVKNHCSESHYRILFIFE